MSAILQSCPSIAENSNIGYDHTIRVWNNKLKVEIAKLTHNAPVIAALWLRDEMGALKKHIFLTPLLIAA